MILFLVELFANISAFTLNHHQGIWIGDVFSELYKDLLD